MTKSGLLVDSLARDFAHMKEKHPLLGFKALIMIALAIVFMSIPALAAIASPVL